MREKMDGMILQIDTMLYLIDKLEQKAKEINNND